MFLSAHTETHTDAPCHFTLNDKSIVQIEVNRFICNLQQQLVVHIISASVERNNGDIILCLSLRSSTIGSAIYVTFVGAAERLFPISEHCSYYKFCSAV